MTAPRHEVSIAFAGIGLSLQASANRILSKIGIFSIKFQEKHLANGDYDFWWLGKKDGFDYQVRGDNWYPDTPQNKIIVSLIGAGAFEKAEQLTEELGKAGWKLIPP